VDLSICIPLFQQSPFRTVENLIQQAEELGIQYEIILVDDASSKGVIESNRNFFRSLPTVRYIVLSKNIGRAKIRNKLASEAKGQYLVFLDGDAILNQNSFLPSYWSKRENAELIVGGRTVGDRIAKCELRWLYSVKREVLSAEERKLDPYSSFMTGNFCCKASVFKKIQFDENIKGYGHEDTLFGLKSETLGISILHINNPLLFEANDINADFLNKSEAALRNLKVISKSNPQLLNKVGLLKLQEKISRLSLAQLFRWFFKLFEKTIRRNLLSSKPKLYFFDLYRLNYLLGLDLR
jgi:glycosyltransferase involved in cell wall biosynthesis